MKNIKSNLFLKSKQIVLQSKVIAGVIEVRDGYIYAIYDYDFDNADIIDYKDKIIAPGLIDSHTHGYKGYSFTGSASASDIDKASKLYLQQGITSILTTVSYNGIKPVLMAIKKTTSGSNIIGLHMEGPFINPQQFGAAPPDTVFLKPNLNHLNDIIKEADGYLKMMSLAPEVDGNDKIIEKLQAEKIIVAAGHTNVSYKQLEELGNKIDVLTHMGNAMSKILHRDMGAFGFGLNSNIFTELIADGLHIERPMLEIIFKIKSVDEIILVSDSIALAGCKKGHYQLAKYNLTINDDGVIINEFGHLSGSSFSLLDIVKNLYFNYNLDLVSLFKMASLNPSRLLKVDNKLGSIKVGKLADIVVFNQDLDVIDVYQKGSLTYNHKMEKALQNPKLAKLLLDPEFLNFYSND